MNRSTAETMMNQSSSRSHVRFFFLQTIKSTVLNCPFVHSDHCGTAAGHIHHLDGAAGVQGDRRHSRLYSLAYINSSCRAVLAGQFTSHSSLRVKEPKRILHPSQAASGGLGGLGESEEDGGGGDALEGECGHQPGDAVHVISLF